MSGQYLPRRLKRCPLLVYTCAESREVLGPRRFTLASRLSASTVSPLAWRARPRPDVIAFKRSGLELAADSSASSGSGAALGSGFEGSSAQPPEALSTG